MNKEYRELQEKGTVGLVELEELRVEYMHLDLASFQSTKEFVEQFKKTGRQLHVLICNAGVSKRQFGEHFYHISVSTQQQQTKILLLLELR